MTIGERIVRIEANTEHLVKEIADVKTQLSDTLQQQDEELTCLQATVDRHSTYWWFFGIGGSVLLAWLSGIGDLVIKKAMGFWE